VTLVFILTKPKTYHSESTPTFGPIPQNSSVGILFCRVLSLIILVQFFQINQLAGSYEFCGDIPISIAL